MTKSTALLSDDRRHRYELGRVVDDAGTGVVVWFMLNPSTADEQFNDATIRRCIGFSKSWGFRELKVVNLISYRSKNRRDIRQFRNPPFEGEYFTNLSHVERVCLEADCIILAWGADGESVGGDAARERACELNDEVWVLGWTSNGQPKHPLYVNAGTVPVQADQLTGTPRLWERSP